MLRFVLAMAVGLILLLIIFLVAAISGRENYKPTEKFMKKRYAHRGLHNQNRPENSLSAFRAAVEKGYAIELDVHVTNDAKIVVVHDNSLKRTTGDDLIVEKLSLAELKGRKIFGSEEEIPTLAEVLEVVDGKVPLLIEMKHFGSNSAFLANTLNYEMRNYKGEWCIESFDPRTLLWFKKNRRDVVRGQLSQNFFKSGDNLPLIQRVVLSLMSFNIITQPDFVAFNHLDAKFISYRLAKYFWNMKTFLWTVRSPEEMKKAEKEKSTVIFEDFEP